MDVITLKTKIENGEIKSRGIAIIQFTTKEGAANALKKMPYEERLGEQGKVIIEFYESRESRMQVIDQKYSQGINLQNLNPTV